MSKRFHIALGVLSLLAVATVIGLVIYSDAISDLLFKLPTWAVVGVIIAWPLVCLAVVCLLTAGKRDEQTAHRALARREHPAVSLDLEVDEWVDWPPNVVAIPERELAEVVPIRGGGGWRA